MQERNKITGILEEAELRRFDSFFRELGQIKSTLIAQLNREYLNKQRFTMRDELPLASQPTATTSGGSR